MNTKTEASAGSNVAQKKRLIQRNPVVSEKTMSALERVRLVILILVLAALAFYAFRRYQWNRETSKIYRLLEREDAQTALAAIHDLDETWGRTGESCFLRGRAYRYLNNVEQSDHAFNQALVEDYNAARLHHEQMLLDVQCVMPLISQTVVDEVLGSYQADLVENATALTRGFLRLHNTQAALLVLGIWKSEEPQSYRIDYLSGIMANQSQLFEDAFQQFQIAFNKNPEFVPLWLELATAYWHANQPTQALELFDTYYEKRPNDARGEGGRIQSMLALKKYEQVNSFFESRKEPLDLNSQARIFRAEAFAGVDKPLNAIAVLEPLLVQWPDDLSANRLMSALYKQRQDVEKSDFYQKRIDELSGLQAVIPALRQAVADAPDDASARYQLGHALLTLESRPDGVEQLEIAISLDPNTLAAHEDLSRYFQAAGNTRAAEFHRQLSNARTETSATTAAQ